MPLKNVGERKKRQVHHRLCSGSRSLVPTILETRFRCVSMAPLGTPLCQMYK
jgi:hypothetical protein